MTCGGVAVDDSRKKNCIARPTHYNNGLWSVMLIGDRRLFKLTAYVIAQSVVEVDRQDRLLC